MKALRMLAIVGFCATALVGQSLRLVVTDEQISEKVTRAMYDDDLNKRLSALDAIMQSNPSAASLPLLNQAYTLTYFNAKNYDKTIEYGEKVLATNPDDAETLAAVVNAAAEKKDYARVMQYAPNVAKALKTAGDTDYAKENRDLAAKTMPFIEYQGFQAVTQTTDPAQQVSYAQTFLKTMPNSQYAPQIRQAAAVALGKMSQQAASTAGEAFLATDPDSVPVLLTLAGMYAEKGRGASLNRGVAHARHAIELLKAQTPPANAPADWEANRKANIGLAYEHIGFIQMKQENTEASIQSLKTARGLLAGNPTWEPIVTYRLGFAYAKEQMYSSAKPVLNRCVQLGGSTAGACRDILQKIAAAGH